MHTGTNKLKPPFVATRRLINIFNLKGVFRRESWKKTFVTQCFLFFYLFKTKSTLCSSIEMCPLKIMYIRQQRGGSESASWCG